MTNQMDSKHHRNIIVWSQLFEARWSGKNFCRKRGIWGREDVGGRLEEQEMRRQLKLKLRRPRHAWKNMIHFWRQVEDFETYQRKFLCIFLHKMKARHYKEQCGRCSSASFRYKGYQLFSLENCICHFADWYRSLVACFPATHTQKNSGLYTYIQHQIN